MSVLPVGFGSSGGINTGDIGHSLRCRSAASAYLSRTPASSGNLKTCTMSMWVKRGTLSTGAFALFGTGANNTNDTICYFGPGATGDQLDIIIRASSVIQGRLTTNQLFRDPTSHMHVVFVYDSPQVTAADRMKLFINGVRVTSFSTETQPAQNTDTLWNTARALYLGRLRDDSPNYLDGYLSRICFVDGTALTPSSFGQFNTEINEWVSKSQSAVKAVVDAGGTNSFMLDFDDATSLTTLGYDKSSKGNNWTLNNFSLTAGTTYDHMLDVPGNSFCTLSPLDKSAGVTVSSAGLKQVVSGASDFAMGVGTLGVSSGKWYFEALCTSAFTSSASHIGWDAFPNRWDATIDNSVSARSNNGCAWDGRGYVYVQATSSVYSYTYTTNDVIMCAFDADTGKVWFGKNGTWNGTEDPVAGTNPARTISTGSTWSPLMGGFKDGTWEPNFGARAFFYQPTGFLALCQENIPTPATALLNPTDHHIDITVTKSGNTNFTLPWDASVYDTFFEIKRRDAAGDWYQIDGLRGYTKILKSNSTAAETTDANVLGVSGTTCTLKSTLADGTYIVSATKAGLTASRQTNTDGSITSTVSRNVDSGFAIVSCTGTAANATVGHGLGVALNSIVAKALGSATEWPVYHSKLANTEYVVLNTTAAKATGATYWNSTTPTTTVFSLGSSTNTNNTGGMVFYCYADSAIQKSFSYTGNASADGPYVNLGFKCGRALFKNTTAGNNWLVFDSTRDTSNLAQNKVAPNAANAENDVVVSPVSENNIDMTALAVKPRTTNAQNNGSGNIIIGHAWAATTGKYSLGR